METICLKSLPRLPKAYLVKAVEMTLKVPHRYQREKQEKMNNQPSLEVRREDLLVLQHWLLSPRREIIRLKAQLVVRQQ